MFGAYQRVALIESALLLALAVSAGAQMEIGENTSLRLNGNVSAGYTGDYSNLTPSDHGFTPGGNADLSGYYYSPNFLSFEAQPFYNQSRLNSNSQSVFQSAGVGASATIFGGSNFPGSVSFSKLYNDESGFALPGVGNLVTSGNSQNIALNWGIRVPDYPKASFQFSDGSSANSIFGTDLNTTAHVRSLGVLVSDTLAGFDLTGGYQHSAQNEVIPELVSGEPAETSNSSVSSFNFGAGHKLPLNGAFAAGFSRSYLTTDYSGGNYDGTIDTVVGSAACAPLDRLNLSVNTQYTDNLSGLLYQPIVTSGGVVPASLLNYSTDSLTVTGQASYSISYVNLIATASHQNQTVLGQSISADTFQEMVNFGKPFLGGFLNATAGVTESAVNYAQDPTTLGEFGTLSYTKKVQGWEFSGSANYSRNTQTVLLTYTSSGQGYSAAIGRRIGAHGHWNANASEVRSSFANLLGSGSSSQSYSTAFSLGNYGVNGGYSKASGNSILTPSGLTPSPIPIPTAQTILFNGSSYNLGAFATPTRGLILSASYSRATSNTLGASAGSETSTTQLVTLLQYRLRQVWLQGGFLRLSQGLSITGQPSSMNASFYVGISRWFNFF
jgi:hypothetical protein